LKLLPPDVKQQLERDCTIFGCAFLGITADGTGYRISPDDLQILNSAIQVVKAPDEDADDRGPNAHYEMFSRKGNDACEALVQRLVDAGESGDLTRKSLEAARRAGQAEIAETHPEVHDTEPDGQICHQLNERLCKPQMWSEYGRWTG
jgi:hypothetical protein